MKRRLFSATAVPHGSGPVVGLRTSAFLLVFVSLVAGGIWIGVVTHRHFSNRVDQLAVRNLEAETVLLEQKVVEFDEEMTLLRETMRSVGGLEERIRSFAGFDRGDYLAAPEMEDLSEPARICSRLDRLTDQAGTQRADFRSILDKLGEDRILRHRVPSVSPVGGWVVREFGYGPDPFTGRVRFHPGIDIAAPKGSLICAPADGRVTFAGLKRDLGLLVILDHGYGYRTYYAHCGFLRVRQGKLVKRGDAIATIGRTGRATGPYLHYQVRVDGQPVDPRVFFLEDLPSFLEFFSSSRSGSSG